MLRTILILLLAFTIGFGSVIALYPDEIDTMISMLQKPNGEAPGGSSGGNQKVEAVSMELDASAAKTVYKFDETFSAEGLKITVTFSDGSTKVVSPDECRIGKVDTTKPGIRQVTVTYGGITERYEVVINAKVYAEIAKDSLVDITEENETLPYRVEAELIDMVTPGAAKADGCESFIATAPDGAAITSGEQYLTGYGVKWNYFGFTFTAAESFENVTIVIRVANSTANDLNAGAVKMYLNLEQAENGSVSGELPLDGYIIPANGACNWSDIVIRNVTIPEGTNTLTFEVQDKNIAFDIDYVDFYVGMRYINSVVEISDTTTIIKDLEKFDTEKAFTRPDMAAAHGLKDGQLYVEAATKESPGKSTHGGTAVGAVGRGSQLSTTLRLAQDATVLIKFKAAKTGTGAYYVKDNWNFYIDGVKLTTVESKDIEGGNKSTGHWWDWIYTNVGTINLTAGDHFFFVEVSGVDCNVDTVEFEIISLGSFDESGVNLEDIAQPEPNPTLSTTIDKAGIYTFEAEDMDISKLTPSEGWESRGVQIELLPNTDPATSGGKSIGACGGGYTTVTFTLKEQATIRVYGRISHLHGGAASKYMSMKIGETTLTASGNLNDKRDDHDYHHWTDVAFGDPMTLEAGTYTLTINFLKNPNFDCVKLNVLSYGEEEAFATIEAETFGKEGVVGRQDMGLTDGNYKTEPGNGATCICGFTSGTWFKLNLNVKSDITLEMFLVGATDAKDYDVSTKFTLTVNGKAVDIPKGLITGSGDRPYWDWQTVSLGLAEFKAGDNEIVLTIVDGHPNFDKVFFVESDGNVTPSAHFCENPCPKCGDCTNTECAESVCGTKCDGHESVSGATPVEHAADVTLAASGNTTVQFETFDLSNSTIVLRDDLISNGFTAPGNSHGRIWGMADGTTIRMYVEVSDACDVTIILGGFGTAMSKYTYKFGGVEVAAEGNYGVSEVVEPGLVGVFAVEEAGVYLFEFTTGNLTDLDYITFIVE